MNSPDLSRTGTEPVVNSWNEWDRLRETVVGIADSACFEPTEPGNQPKLRRNESAPFPAGPKSIDAIKRANEELDGLAEVLENHNVVVRRPSVQDYSEPIRTPHFSVENQYCAVCPRDVMITLGTTILEATMSRRARYFEYEVYRGLVYQYWNTDPGMSWQVAPKPTMSDDMYSMEFWDRPIEERHARMHEFEFCIGQDEVVFDAADISRYGRDLFVQESMTTNRAGIDWLTRTLAPSGFRVHPVHFPLDLFPSHIDCTFVPLRPGLILTNPDRPIRTEERQLFLDNDWRFIDAPEPTLANDEMPEYCQSSKWLSMNVLSISPEIVVCEEREKPLHDMLAAEGFEVVTLPFRNVFEYGGSLHCATWDVRREGGCEDYFPTLSAEPTARG